MHPERGRAIREEMARLARISGEREFCDPSWYYEPDAATLEFADIVHNRLGVPQGDYCYSNNDPVIYAAVEWYGAERQKGAEYAFNHL